MNLTELFINANSKSLWILISIIVFSTLGIVFYFTYLSPTSSYEPNHEHLNKEEQPHTHTAEIYRFFATWCPHCTTSKPLWEEIKEEYKQKHINGYKLIFIDIDCSQEEPDPDTSKKIKEFNVTGFPTIKMLKGNEIIDYDSDLNKNTFHNFLTTCL